MVFFRYIRKNSLAVGGAVRHDDAADRRASMEMNALETKDALHSKRTTSV